MAFFRKESLLSKMAAIIVLVLILVVCWCFGMSIEKQNVRVPDYESFEAIAQNFPFFSVTKRDQETDPANASLIDFSKENGDYHISEGGDFLLRGELNGTLYVDAVEQNVHLFLDNVSVISPAGPAVICSGPDKIVCTLMPDTHNYFSDFEDNRDKTQVEACFYSESDITFNGTGELTVNGYYEDAIRSKDIVKVLDGSYKFKCKRTAVHANDGIYVAGGQIEISSEKAGFKTTNLGSEGKGNIIIIGGTHSVIAGRYSFVAEKADLVIANCSVTQQSTVSPYDVGGTKYIEEGCVS